ncbi:MAG: DUF4833 domain-containing protein [Ignavibacteriae bacterium]|nr:MAG: DUF4833 domain-containing protein [Ignavibacteriota bacterium]
MVVSFGVRYLLFLVLSLVVAGDGNVRSHRLFVIELSKGTMTICYDAVTENGRLREDEPMDIYWNFPDREEKREDLNWIEKWQAYGVDVINRFDGLDSMDIKMKANKKKLRIVQRDGRWMALTYVNGKVCQLMTIYVRTDESGFVPKVIDVTFKGRVRTTGEVVTEMLKP